MTQSPILGASRRGQVGHSLPILVIPSRGVDVVVLSQVVEVLDKTTTETDLEAQNVRTIFNAVEGISSTGYSHLWPGRCAWNAVC